MQQYDFLYQAFLAEKPSEIINEYIYISPKDKENNEEGMLKNYQETFKKIISSFKFLK